MTDLIYDSISQGVDLLLTAVILSSIISMLYTTTYLNNIIGLQQERIDSVTQAKQYNQYLDGSTITESDIVSCIISKGEDINILMGANTSNPPVNSYIVSGPYVIGKSLPNWSALTTAQIASNVTSKYATLTGKKCKVGYITGAGTPRFVETSDYDLVNAIWFY